MSIRNTDLGTGAHTNTQNALRIVMADDDPQEHILIVMASGALSTPLEFDFVTDGAKLLQTLDRAETVAELPDLIILDLRMPRLDGHRVLQELQAHPTYWQIPVVVFSSSARIQDEALSYTRGAVMYRTKPSSFAGMEEFLEVAINVARNANPYEEIPVDPIDLTDVIDVRPEPSFSLEEESNW